MKNLFLILVLLGFLFFHITASTMNYQEYAKKWYSDLSDKKFNNNERLLVIGQIIAINQCLVGLQMLILNKINESEKQYKKSESQDELKIGEDVLSALKKENEKSFFGKLRDFYYVYKTVNRINKIIPCIRKIFEDVVVQQCKNTENFEKIVQDLIIVILAGSNAGDEKIMSLLSIIKPIQEIFAEIIKLNKLQQESSCVIL